ncbi:DNA methyltransferase [uncultured Microbacterium sp.]|uniref:DNA methyltransferase n=1 Tax=uncultured Microbacterium sp. TaxID=191216 RepID=UPI003749AF8F
MTLHYEDAGLRLWHGPNMEILPAFADASFDSIVTDPPYELGFMGKGWDSSGIAYDVDVWRECLRVLKPGGHLLAFGGSRTWHRMAVAIEDAGFEMRDSIAWLYGSGFPKSMSVSKAIDATLLHGGSNSRRIREANESRPGEGRIASALPQNGIMGVAAEARVSRDEPATDEAREWDGWGTALKPAFEPIVVARKPFRGTVATNVLRHGTGALNIDATRTAMSDADRDAARVPMRGASPAKVATPADRGAEYFEPAASGRWPTNVLLTHSPLLDEHGDIVGDACTDGCVPGCAVAVLDAQSGVLSSGVMRAGTRAQSSGGDIYGKRGEFVTSGATYGDSGGASRFFPTFRYEAKAPTSERPNVEGTVHATVKPLALIRWLVRLVTRPGGRVVDLYAGSGTTGEAALLEGMEVDLIELEEAHLPLILARVRKPLHPGLFGDWEDAS